MSALNEWGNFYVIVGSSAGALIGLQFVVMTLIAGRSVGRGEAQAGDAFATPSVVHFGVVLLLSAVISVPWNGIGAVVIVCGFVGLLGIPYVAVVIWRMRTQKVYEPVFEDWLCHALLPLGAYALLAGSAFVARSNGRVAQFLVGGAALLLLFVGIHNAWDTVMHLVFVEGKTKEEDELNS